MDLLVERRTDETHRVRYGYENVDGSGNFGVNHVASPESATKPRKSTVADLDDDGDLDIVFAPPTSSLEQTWLENEGNGSFVERALPVPVTAGVRLVEDLDADGDSDLLSLNFLDAAWYENLGGAAAYQRHEIEADRSNKRPLYVRHR